MVEDNQTQQPEDSASNNNQTSQPAKQETAAEKILRQLAERKKAQANGVELNYEEFKEVKADLSHQQKMEAAPKAKPHAEAKAHVEASAPEPEEDETDDHHESSENLSDRNLAGLEKGQLLRAFVEELENGFDPHKREVFEEIKNHFYKKHNEEIAQARKDFVEAGNPEEEFKPTPDPLELEMKSQYNKYRDMRSNFKIQQDKKMQDNLDKKLAIIERIKALSAQDQEGAVMNVSYKNFEALRDEFKAIGPVPSADNQKTWESYHMAVTHFYDFVRIDKELRELDMRKNLEKKVELCEKAEELILEEKVVKAFRQLQQYHDMWREIGPVPREHSDEVWDRFKKASTEINKRHQDYFDELKKQEEQNLEAKQVLCEKVEEIAALDFSSMKDWDKRSQEIVEIQKIWKLIGFAPKKLNNKIYDRFREACDRFFSRKREHFDQFKEKRELNHQLKTELCIKAESLKDSTDWKKTTDQIIQLQEEWKSIGPSGSRKAADDLWKRFRTACNAFFDTKKVHFKSIDKEYQDNLDHKLALIEKVKALEFGPDSSENLQRLKELQKQWTEIGFVPSKRKDEVYDAWREAVDAKFDLIKVDSRRRDDAKFRNRLDSIGANPGRATSEREKVAKQLRELENDIHLWENNLGFFANSKNAAAMVQEFQKKIDVAKEEAKLLKKQLGQIDRMSAQPKAEA